MGMMIIFRAVGPCSRKVLAPSGRGHTGRAGSELAPDAGPARGDPSHRRQDDLCSLGRNLIDRDNRISLSRFQLVLWVCVLISACLLQA